MSGNWRMESKGRQGMAMLAALALLITAGAGAALVWRGLHQELAGARAERLQETAYWIAEGGVHHALARLAEDGAYRGGEETPLGGGAFRVEVSPEGAGAYRIRVTGEAERGGSRAGRMTLTAKARTAPGGPVLMEIRRGRAWE